MATDPANQIIRQVCKETLLPLGVFQKGNSRTYIDDSGYFFTVVEFQPSSYTKGTYLNVALHFLWNRREYICFDFPFGPEIQLRNFAAYQNDEQFTAEVTQYARAAAEKILFYRQLRDMDAAKQLARTWSRKYQGNRHADELAMIHRLDEAEVVQSIQETRAFWRSKPSMKKMKTHDIFDP